MGSIVQVNRPKLPSYHANRLQQILTFWEYITPAGLVLRSRGVHSDQPVAWCIDVGQHVQATEHMFHHGLVGFKPFDHRLPIGITSRQRQHMQAVAIGAGACVQDRKLTIFGGVDEVVAVGLILIPEHQNIFLLWCPYFVEIHAVEGVFGRKCGPLWSGVSAVIKPTIDPCGARKLDPLQYFSCGFPCGHIQNTHFLPIRSCSIAHFDHMPTIWRGTGQPCSDGSIFTQAIGVQKHLFCSVFLLNEGDTLVLKSVVSGQENALSNGPWNPHPGMVVEFLAPRPDRFPLGQGVQKGTRCGLLGSGPSDDFGVPIVFKPTVRVFHGGLPQGVHHLFLPCSRVFHGVVVGGLAGQYDGRKNRSTCRPGPKI